MKTAASTCGWSPSAADVLPDTRPSHQESALVLHGEDFQSHRDKADHMRHVLEKLQSKGVLSVYHKALLNMDDTQLAERMRMPWEPHYADNDEVRWESSYEFITAEPEKAVLTFRLMSGRSKSSGGVVLGEKQVSVASITANPDLTIAEDTPLKGTEIQMKLRMQARYLGAPVDPSASAVGAAVARHSASASGGLPRRTQKFVRKPTRQNDAWKEASEHLGATPKSDAATSPVNEAPTNPVPAAEPVAPTTPIDASAEAAPSVSSPSANSVSTSTWGRFSFRFFRSSSTQSGRGSFLSRRATT